MRHAPLLLLVVLLAASCGGGDEPAPETKPEEKPAETKPAEKPASSPGGGLDLETLQARMEAQKGPSAEETAPAEPAPAVPPGEEPGAAEETATAPEKVPEEAPSGPPADAPRSLSDITDEEVLASWSKEEREALEEMPEEERKQFMEDKRVEIFESRGGTLVEESGKMEDQEVDPATGMRGPARPDVVRAEDLPPPGLRDILDALKSPDPEIQAGAAEAAKRFEDKAVAAKHIVKLLESTNWELRGIAAATLGALGQESAVPALLKLVDGESNDGVRGKAVGALRDIGGKEGIAALRQIVREGWQPTDRAAALSMLTDMGDASAVKDLIKKCLDDVTPQVRQSAVVAIRTFKFRDFGGDLLPLLEDYSDQVIIEALRALGELEIRPAVGPMVKLLVSPDPESENPEAIQDAAAAALTKVTQQDLGYASTLPEEQRLAAIDNWKQWWAKNKDAWR